MICTPTQLPFSIPHSSPKISYKTTRKLLHSVGDVAASNELPLAVVFGFVPELEPEMVILAIFPSASSISTSMSWVLASSTSTLKSSSVGCSFEPSGSRFIISTNHLAPSSQPASSASPSGERPAWFLISIKSRPGPLGCRTSCWAISS